MFNKTAVPMSQNINGRPVFLINDLERVQEVGPNINFDSLEKFHNSKRIFEKNKWSIHEIKLSLNGIINPSPVSLLMKFGIRVFLPIKFERINSIRG